jgi:transcriptional regulator with XRE-family HTH domain
MVSVDKVPEMLGRRVKKLREGKELSQEKLALEAGLNRAYIGYIERGERNPSIKTMTKIANVLKLPLHEIFKF